MPWEKEVKQSFIDCEVAHVGRASEPPAGLPVGCGCSASAAGQCLFWGQAPLGFLCVQGARGAVLPRTGECAAQMALGRFSESPDLWPWMDGARKAVALLFWCEVDGQYRINKILSLFVIFETRYVRVCITV